MAKSKGIPDGPSSIAGRLRPLGFQRYADYLESAHWQATRRRYYASDRPQRCECGAKPTALHHLTYVRLGAELLTDLVAICDDCHRAAHAVDRAPAKPKPKPKPAKQRKRKGWVKDKRLQTQSYECPLCAAKPGQRCRRGTGKSLTQPHPERWHAAAGKTPTRRRQPKKQRSKAPVKRGGKLRVENDWLHAQQQENRRKQAAAREARRDPIRVD